MFHALARIVLSANHLFPSKLHLGARCRPSQHALDLLHLCFWNPKSHPRLPLNIGTWTAVRHTLRKDDIDRNNKLNNKIIIISKDQTAVHHSNHHVALASLNNDCVQNDTSYETTNYIVFLPLYNLSTFKLPVVNSIQRRRVVASHRAGPGRILGNWTLAYGCAGRLWWPGFSGPGRV